MNTKLTKAEFLALVESYLGAREHERWTREQASWQEHFRAVEASKAARKALEDAVFPS